MTMSAEAGFDATAGRLRLSRRLLADLCALHGTGDLNGDSMKRLRDGGMLVGNKLHPNLVALAATAARPQARLSLDLTASDRALHCEGWLDARFALLLSAPAPDIAVCEAAFMPRSWLAAGLARMVELGPRPRSKVDDAVEIDQGLWEAIAGAGGALTTAQIEMLIEPRDELVPAWLETLASLSGGIKTRWRAGVWWNSLQETPEARLLEVVDSTSGLFFLSRVPQEGRRYRRLRVRPVTPAQVWRLLASLAPRPAVVSEPLGP